MKIDIAGKSIPSGTAAHGFLEVTKAADNAPVGLPWIVVNGKHDGPVLEIDGAVHGNEDSGTDAILRLSKHVQPEQLHGTLILMPVLNVAAYRASVRTNPLDELDMNRIYPGKKKGRTTERLADAHMNEFLMKSDYIVNCHCGGGTGLGPRDFVTVTPKGFKEASEKALELGKASGIQCVDQKDIGKLWYGGSIALEAARHGKPVVLPEINTEDRFKDIDNIFQSFLNMMYHLHMLSGKPVMPKIQYITQNEFIKPNRGGLWVPLAKLHDEVKQGQLVGKVLDPFTGDVVEELKAPYDGIFLQHCGKAVVTTEDFGAYYMGKIVEKIEN